MCCSVPVWSPDTQGPFVGCLRGTGRLWVETMTQTGLQDWNVHKGPILWPGAIAQGCFLGEGCRWLHACGEHWVMEPARSGDQIRESLSPLDPRVATRVAQTAEACTPELSRGALTAPAVPRRVKHRADNCQLSATDRKCFLPVVGTCRGAQRSYTRVHMHARAHTRTHRHTRVAGCGR